MTYLWKDLLHENFRCGRMYTGRAGRFSGCCALPFYGRM